MSAPLSGLRPASRGLRILVCGSTGCVGRAVAQALRARGHAVVDGARSALDTRHAMPVDFMSAVSPERWAERLAAREIDVVINCVGILMPRGGSSFARVHTDGPIELFRGAALAGVRRVVQVSALGVGDDAESVATPYLHSKLLADEALAALPLDAAVVRPALLYGPGSASAALFATLVSLPVISLPGRGQQRLQPLHVYELAEAIARLVESPDPVRGVHELGGGEVLSYREMLGHYRHALGLGEPLWVPVPVPLMSVGARLAEALPQQVYCRDTIRLLTRELLPAPNASTALLGRAPSRMAQGLAITPPAPLVDLRVSMSPAVAGLMRLAIAFMWLYTAAISLLLREESGVMELLARCGFTGDMGTVALIASCTLNTALGLTVLLRPTGLGYAMQAIAVVGYTATAAWHMPELTLDHCGPLVKNLPVLAGVVALWLNHRDAMPTSATRGLDKLRPGANT